MEIKASKPGAPTPKLDKRTNDTLYCKVNVSDLLDPNEVIFGKVVLDVPAPLAITDAKNKLGKFVEFKVSGGPTSVPYQDYLVVLTVKTSLNSSLTIPISIRAYSK